MKISRYWQDVAERAGRTFLQGYFGAWLVASAANAPIDTYHYLFTLHNLRSGVVMVALSVAMSVGAKNFGNKNSASLLPKNRP